MKRLNGYKTRLMFVGVMAVMAFGGGSANADFTFGEPVHLGPPISDASGGLIQFLTADALEMYSCFFHYKPGGLGGWDIWVYRREKVNDDWGEPENLGPPINTSQSDSQPTISSDGLEMHFVAYNRPGGYGDCDIWVSRRASKYHPWAQPVNLGNVINTGGYEHSPRISPDGLELYFSSNRPGGCGYEDIWVTKRATRNDPWGQPVNLGPPVNSAASEDNFSLSPDGLLLLFSGSGYRNTTQRLGGYGESDLWVARRASVSEPWGEPVNLGPMVNTPYLDCGPILSPDGHSLYFSSERPGGLGGPYGDSYQVQILPILDFNGDQVVNVQDVVIMTEHWGENYPLCDIGPMPWGDGIVDVQDLVVLTEQMEELANPTPVAHWAFDETEGTTAFDSAGENDAYIVGDPVWQPTEGQINGAIQLDGVDDFLGVGPILNPAAGPFSVYVWIKGGAPGQAIISKTGDANWLSLDPLTGHLMTELTKAGRGAAPLRSQAAIADGDWHRIGFVWDGLYRTLYVDGVAVAEDTQDSLASSGNGFYIGTGKDLDPASFFGGLIDDIRIYNRAVNP